MANLEKFDAARYLTSEVAIAEFLLATLEYPNPKVFGPALEVAVKARNIIKTSAPVQQP